LRKIDEMLDAELPKGTNLAKVNWFLSERGYPTETVAKPNTIVARVRLIDTDTLQPANARATFHFDARNQLTSYELEAAPDLPLHP
jgi:hypothetical protein